jgi:hypothetical protein
VYVGEVTPPDPPPDCEIEGKVLLTFYPEEGIEDPDTLETAMYLYVRGSMCGHEGGIGAEEGQRYEGLCVSTTQSGNAHVVGVDNGLAGVFGVEGTVTLTDAKGKIYKLEKDDQANDSRWPGYSIKEFLGTYQGSYKGWGIDDVTCPW